MLTFQQLDRYSREAAAAANPKTLIIHIHGGGFVASASSAHQYYLRKWAKSIPDSVVASIDYRLAPESSYPAALDDVWQGYYWLVKHSRDILGITPK